MSSQQSRFDFFSKQVAQVSLWHDFGGSLFRELKEGRVQEFMDTLHKACDGVFEAILREEKGNELLLFGPPELHSPLVRPARPVPTQWRATGSGREGQARPGRAVSPPRVGATGVPQLVPWLADDEEEVVVEAAAVEARLVPGPTRLGPDHFGVEREGTGNGPAQGSWRGPNERGEARSLPPLASAAIVREGDGRVAVEAQLAPGSARLGPLSTFEERGANGGASNTDEDPKSDRPTLPAIEPIRRQDHPRVRAIRLQDEDWREVQLEQMARAKHGDHASTHAIDEDVYISQLHRRAVLLDDEFQSRVHSATHSRFGHRVHVSRAPVKTKERMREKVSSYLADGETTPLAANILDPLRVSLVCSSPAEVLEVASWLVQHGPAAGLPVVRIKNKFALPDAREYDGYRDLMLCVLFEGSLSLAVVGEIQIHIRQLHELKLLMHKLYKVKRATTANSI